MRRAEFLVENADGWALDVKRYHRPDRPHPAAAPIVFIPGYCMNTFILAFHPNGRSLVEYLVDHGYDVWTANLRGQGDSRPIGRRRPVSFADWCDVDVPCVLAHIQRHTTVPRPTMIGCSLGGTVAYAYLARNPGRHQLCAAVAIGAPLRWPQLPIWARPLVQWPGALGHVRLRGTRRLARKLLPFARRLPAALSLYLNTAHVRIDRADILTQTIDDPEPGINEALVRWLRHRDLIVGETNVTTELRHADLPLLAIYANGDGIVPPQVARAVADFVPRDRVTTLEVGDNATPFAHADMFISDYAESRVFAPLERWLSSHLLAST